MRSHAVLAVCIAVIAAGTLIAAGLSSADSSGQKLHWAMAESSLEHLIAADAGQAAAEFNSSETLVQNDPPLDRSPVPEGWSSTSTERWASYAEFAADVAANSVPPYVRVVHYDNESWSETPLAEQLHPIAFERRFCNLAHSHGWSCYTGPAQDLCGVIAHPRGETNAKCYLDLNLAGRSARFSDIIDIQAQALEPRGAAVYGHFIRRAAAQAYQANPNVLVLGNIAASPSTGTLTAPQLLKCAEAALPYVSGFYTTVSKEDAPAMAAFLAMLGR